MRVERKFLKSNTLKSIIFGTHEIITPSHKSQRKLCSQFGRKYTRPFVKNTYFYESVEVLHSKLIQIICEFTKYKRRKLDLNRHIRIVKTGFKVKRNSFIPNINQNISTQRKTEIEQPLRETSKSESDTSSNDLYALSDLIEHNSTEEDSFIAENKIKQDLMAKLQELKEKLKFGK